MIYIKKIHLENFQSHKNTTLIFDRGLNVILGNSDSGKTAILRAIKWAIYNEPQGDYFIMQGTNKVLVEIEFSNGAIVKRLKSSSKNNYYLKLPDEEEQIFEAFGRSVPQEIIDVTGMYKISLTDDKSSILNIAEQLDGPFLLNQVPSVRASAIGRLVSVNYIDDALRDTVREDKSVNNNIKILEKNKDELESKIKEFDYLKDLEVSYNSLKDISRTIKEKSNKLKLFKTSNISLREIDKEIKVINDNLVKLPNIKILSDLVERLTNISYKHKYLKNLCGRLENVDSKICTEKKYLYKFKDLISFEDLVFKLINNLQVYEKFTNLYNRYLTINGDYNKTNSLAKDLVNVQKIHIIYSDLDNKLRYLKVLKTYNSTLYNIEDSLTKGNDFISNFNNLNTAFELFNVLNIKSKLLFDIKSFGEKLLILNKNIKEEENIKNNIINKIKSYSNDYEKTILNMGICPFCYNKITEESIKHIKEHIQEE